MAKPFKHIRFIAGALALAFIVAVATPVSAQQPSSVNPTASAVNEQKLLQRAQQDPGSRHYSGREVLHIGAAGGTRVAALS